MPDLAPTIVRQRLVLEGVRDQPLSVAEIESYLAELSEECEMKVLMAPVTHQSERFGWAGWVHWEASGAHFYAWDDPVFFSVDVYTCARFDAERVARFTKEFFHAARVVGRTI